MLSSRPRNGGLIWLILLLSSLQNNIRLCFAEFNFETGRRIHERVSAFMSQPMDVLLQVASYRANEAFPHDMGAADRNAFFKLNDALMETYPQFESIYYGLEDGVFVGHGFNSKIANYREPGHSGYAVDDQSMEKHYNACVNSTSGGNLQCKMSEGGKYTQCIEDCALQICADEDSQKECSEVLDSKERLDCEASIKWCTSYVIKEAAAGSQLGFVARSTHCINSLGIPTQTPGEVAKKDTQELGNCFFEDGVTPVERNFAGDYAYCGGDGKVCNDTFAGAFKIRDYDPRWRGWYIETKAIQKPNWSRPYVFFSTEEMGITFSHPIYTKIDDSRNTFFGVLAIDYTFRDITNFLEDNYKDSSTTVSVFEMEEPSYLVASSTGSKGVKKVLKSNEKQPCSDPDSGDCKAIRVPASELSESDRDLHIAKAFFFLDQKSRGYPQSELVSSEVEGEDFLYATFTQEYSIPRSNLAWRVMVMIPIETETRDALMPGHPLSTVVIAVSVMGFIICGVLCVLLIRNRKHREVIVSDWRFMGLFVAACAVLNASSLVLLGPNTDTLCLTRMWLIHFFFVLALSFLFVKTFRIYKLVGAGAVRRTISHKMTLQMVIPFVLVQVQTVILLIFTFVDPNKQTSIVEEDGSSIEHRYVCGHKTRAFFAVMLIYEGGLLLVGCYLALKTRHLQSEFNESKQIILAMYDTAVVASILLIVCNAVVEFQGEQRLLFSVGIFWTTCFACAVFVIPRLMRVRKKQVAAKLTNSVSGRVNISGITPVHSSRIIAEMPSVIEGEAEDELNEKSSASCPSGSVTISGNEPVPVHSRIIAEMPLEEGESPSVVENGTSAVVVRGSIISSFIPEET